MARANYSPGEKLALRWHGLRLVAKAVNKRITTVKNLRNSAKRRPYNPPKVLQARRKEYQCGLDASVTYMDRFPGCPSDGTGGKPRWPEGLSTLEWYSACGRHAEADWKCPRGCANDLASSSEPQNFTLAAGFFILMEARSLRKRTLAFGSFPTRLFCGRIE